MEKINSLKKDTDRRTILVVDDTPQNIGVLHGVLGDKYRVKAASSGEDALEVAESHSPPDMILLDIMMPVMDGYEVCRRLKANPLTAKIPVIFVTAKTEICDEQKGLELGAVDYITKPFSPPIVKARVFTHLALHEKKQELESKNTQLQREVADRKKAEDMAKQAKTAADEANRAKSTFLATMSHEIRTPMNGVVGMIDLLRQTVMDSDQRQMIETARDSAFGLLHIIDDILDFSKIEAGKMSLEQVPVSIRDVIEGVAETLAPNAVRKGLRLLIYIDPDIPDQLFSDPVRLRQILFNLGGNAIKFTSSVDDRTGLVIMRADLVKPIDQNEAQLRIRVIDNGIGMNHEAVQSLFLPFTQANSATTRQFGGTGLGLSICKRLTEMMAGQIFAESEPDKGTTFTVLASFPLIKIEGKPPSNSTNQELKGIRVLLVSSQADLTGFLLHYVKHWKADCQHTNDLSKVVKMAAAAAEQEQRFDVVVVDDGWTKQGKEILRRQFREHAVLAGTRFVILSNRAEKLTELECPDSIILRSDPLRRSNFIEGVAIAVGRASPELTIQEQIPVVASVTPPSIDEAEASGLLVLVAEDNEINQQVFKQQLKLLGYAAEIASNGKEAFAMWKKRHYALVLTDCHMPEMDGFELTEVIRKDQALSDGNNPPIIAITANALQGEAERCLAAGMDDYLAKPVELLELRCMLKKWMGVSSSKGVVVQEATEDSNVGQSPIDPTALAKLLGDDPLIHRQFLKKFIAITPPQVEEIHYACSGHVADQVTAQAHKLKSSALAVGANALADVCDALEEAGKRKAWDRIDELDAQMDSLLDELVAYVTSADQTTDEHEQDQRPGH